MHRLVLIACFALAASAGAQSPTEWTSYGRDAAGTRYSPLTQIDRANVAQLTVAWTYRTGETEATHQPAKLETTPLVVGGTMYISTPFGRAIALDPATGRERWRFEANVDRNGNWGDFASRGVSTWVDSTVRVGQSCRRRIYLPTIDARIIALDARNGRPCANFGDRGTIDLRRGLRNTPFEAAEYQLTSPPAMINGLLVTGSSVADNNRTNAASGEVRAFDARTGALRWTWDPVPRDSTDAQWSTWRTPMAHSTGASNAWSVIAADPARDLVFVPTGSPSPDYYGGERLGDNRYANSIVALKASTGRVVWHFQTVHHDLWDYDNASPPLLTTITHAGRRVDVVLQATKTGQLYVLDRETGHPVFPVEERPVPASTLLGERASPTQPFNTVVAPLSPQRFFLDSIWAANDAERESCRSQLSGLRYDGPFTPPSLQGTIALPSNVGGAHWGGVAVDTARQIAVVPVNHLVAMVQLIPLDRFDTLEARQNASRLDDQYTRMHGTPYVMRRRIVKSPSGIPCAPTPWGSFVAIDLKTGAKLWDVPLGDPTNLKPEAARLPKPPTGLPNLGGPMVTAGGIAFVGAAIDHFIRAFDIETGKELWRGPLPAGARATPMTYASNGRQYVVIAVGGQEDWGAGDYFVAFALPRQ
ncbi:MAG TPA: pyrroloquinoline quinone-dependent dehydrogenase [Gemmatimonadaceae bacterium]|jgi:quinoprotein glucose dehydrogenase